MKTQKILFEKPLASDRGGGGQNFPVAGASSFALTGVAMFATIDIETIAIDRAFFIIKTTVWK